MKTSLSTLIPGMLIILCTACPSGNDESTKQSGQHQVEMLDEFVITAYSGPPLEEVNIERYREIAYAGIDVIVPGNGTFDGGQNLKALELAQQAGIRVLPIDTRVMPFAQTAGISLDTALIEEMVNDYKDHPAFAGYVIRDEPDASLFPALRDLYNLFREADPGHEPFINLFPSYANPTQLGSVDFRSHIREFIETINPGLLSYDNYALREPDTWYDYWFSDLDVVRDETRKANIPFWVFIQSEGIREHMRVPTRAEILWQVNTCLAYGARGLGWFTYWTPEVDQGIQQVEGAPPPLIEQHYGGMLDVDGNRTPLYDHVREANLYTGKAGRGLIDWDNAFVARYEDGKLLEGGSSPIITPVGDQAHLVVGTFTQDDKRRVVISNSRCETATSFSLNLSPDWQVVKLVTSIDATPGNAQELDGQWTLEAGGSVILEFKPKS
ncbi:hypothetical protein ES705_34527 [subsurface metagenome]